MLDEEIETLHKRFGINATDKLIFDLSTYIASKGKKYKCHYATMLRWAKKNGIVEVRRTTASMTQEELTPEQKKKNCVSLRENMTKRLIKALRRSRKNAECNKSDCGLSHFGLQIGKSIGHRA